MKADVKKNIEKHLGVFIFLVVWAAMIAWFWIGQLFDIENMEAVYSLGAFYVLLPASALVTGGIYGAGNSKLRYIFPIFAGLMELLLGFLTFDLLNVTANGKWNSWNGLHGDSLIFLFSFLPALIGVVAGGIGKKMKKTDKNTERKIYKNGAGKGNRN